MTPVIDNHYQVAVIGAGPAGITAAAAAAKTGSVLLIESSDRFGGSVTAAMHRSMCGLYSHAPQNPLDTLNDSAQRQIVQKMLDKAPADVRPRQFGKAWVLEFPSTAWQSSLAEIADHANIHLQLNTKATAIRRDNNRITAIQIETPDPHWINIDALIDCTGGGHMLRLLGDDARQVPDPHPMLAGFAARLTGLTGDAEILRLQIPYLLTKAVQDHTLPNIARFTVFYPGPAQAEGICKLAINPHEFSTAQAEALTTQIIDYLKHENTAFANVKILEMSPRILPRDGLRLRGKYTISEDDILTAKKFGQSAVHAWWPIERWDLSIGPSYIFPPPNDHYDIPNDALQSAKIENLFAAGTCISATATAAASTRASGICLATGDAAGRLAIESM